MKTLKRIVSWLLVAAFLFGMGTVTAFGAAGTISVSSVTGEAGDTVTVDILMDVNPGAVALKIEVGYDAALSLTDVKNGTVFPQSGMTIQGDKTANPYGVLWNNGTAIENFTGTGTLVTLTFKIADNATPGDKPITLTYSAPNTFDVDFNPVTFTMTGGKVTVFSELSHTHEWSSGVVTPPTATQGGYTTYTCSICGRIVTAHETPPTGSPVYTFTFDANGGTVQQQTTYVKTYAAGDLIPGQTAVRNGCTFIGWYPAAPETMPPYDMTVYAVWKPAHEHETVILNKQEPTCETSGNTGHVYCVTCNEVIEFGTVIPAAGHAWDSGSVTAEASCTEPGVRTLACMRCSSTREETIPAWGHVYDSGFVSAPPGCTAAGEMTFACVACGETYTEPVPAVGHSFDSGSVTTEPTCTAEGVKTFTCTVCGETNTEPVPAVGHNYTFEIETLPTCTVDGVMRYTCSACGDTYTSPIHASHRYNAVVTSPTCTEGGFTTYTCPRCGDTYTADETEALDHLWHEVGVTTEPTCGTNGSRTVTCERCGITQTESIPATGEHEYYAVVTEPTCVSYGYTTYYCAFCGDNYIGDIFEALGHYYASVLTEPTCTEEGVMLYTCNRCGDTYTEMICPLGHDWGAWSVAVDPTFTSEGLERRVCLRCNAADERTTAVLPPDTPAITVSDAVVGCSAGRMVRVTVNMKNNPGIIAARLHIGYDPQQLRLVKVENGSVFDSSKAVFGANLSASPYTVLWSDEEASTDNTTDGTLVTLVFEVQKTTTVGSTAVTVTLDEGSTFNADLQRRKLQTCDGTVQIVDCTPGDANGDGEIDLLDVAMMIRVLAGWSGLTVNEINADVSGDGIFNVKDAAIVRRFLAGGLEITLL